MQNKVLEANKTFYEVVAPSYEKIDSRRSQIKQRWLSDILQTISARLRKNFAGESLQFLDAGAGSGFLSRHADGIFPQITALDLSPKMLQQIANLSQSHLTRQEGSCENIPASAETFHAVGAFATLHHLYEPAKLFAEAHRVLKKEGIFYSDHDLSMAFAQKFRWPLHVYRHFFDHGHQYLADFPSLSKDQYELSEFHGDRGLDENLLISDLQKIGFREIHLSCHWQGAGSPGILFGHLPLFRETIGWAPMLRIVAKK